MKYRTFGPIEIPRSGTHIRSMKDEKRKFFNGLDNLNPGLSAARGVYLIALRNSQGYSPIYVGKTDRQGFSNRVLSDDFITKYRNKIERPQRKGTPVLFLIARMQENGRRFSTATNPPDIKWLEKRIIELAQSSTAQVLINQQNTKYWKNLELPGIFNTKKGGTNQATRELKICLGRSNRNQYASDSDEFSSQDYLDYLQQEKIDLEAEIQRTATEIQKEELRESEPKTDYWSPTPSTTDNNSYDGPNSVVELQNSSDEVSTNTTTKKRKFLGLF